jgi:hypothetical protein
MPILNRLTRDEDTKATAKLPYRLLEKVPDHDVRRERHRQQAGTQALAGHDMAAPGIAACPVARGWIDSGVH